MAKDASHDQLLDYPRLEDVPDPEAFFRKRLSLPQERQDSIRLVFKIHVIFASQRGQRPGGRWFG